MKRSAALFSILVLVLAFALAVPAADGIPYTQEEADQQLAIADRMIQGGIYDRALELARSVLDHPGAQAVSGGQDEIVSWLERREAARFIMGRGLFGLAATRDEFLAAADEFASLSNNRYRLPEPRYNIQSAYWAGRAHEAVGEHGEAVNFFSRVGGITLPAGMEGDAAQRMSRSLRLQAEEIPYPGSIRDRQRRDRLINLAINELDRARLAFPIGAKRKEIELDLIALRMARRDGQSVNEAATEAEAFIASDPAKDELRARAALFRGQAAAILGDPAAAAVWFSRVVDEEAPSGDDRRSAEFGMALARMEMSGSSGTEEKARLLNLARESLDRALDGTMSPGPWDGGRIMKARILLELERPTAALEALAPILGGKTVNHGAWREAGVAELRRGRLGEALGYLYPSTRPSNPRRALRYDACREGSRTADARRDYGLALALNRQTSRMLREERLFPSLLVSEFQAMETLLKLGKMGGPVSLSGDIDLLSAGADARVVPIEDKRREAADSVAAALGRMLAGGGDPDTAYDLAMAAETAHEWAGEGMDKLELAIGMISHLRKRQPEGVTDSILSSRLGESRHALGLARAERILGSDRPDDAEIDRTLGDFAAAAENFQEASSGGLSLRDSLDQGMVNMESGAFLMRLAEKWGSGRWSAEAMRWREEARLRIEASLRPFNQAIATAGPSGPAARRAKWSRGRALELLEEWRGAAGDYLSLMNNSELPRVIRVNAARRWAVCMGELGDSRQALARLAVFADNDAETALLAGKLAEDAGLPRDAHQRFLFAANPRSPVVPPATPGRVREAAYRAAKLALADPNEANPLLSRDVVINNARELLERNSFADLGGPWAVPMLNLLGESWMSEHPGGWRVAHRLALDAINRREGGGALDRAMRIMAARALAVAEDYPRALDELDAAGELLDDTAESRADAATVMLETARVYHRQGRDEDAVRAYADVFAVYPEAVEAAEAARREAALILLSAPGAGAREQEQARGILSGLRDQMLAEKIMRDHGMR